MHRNGYAIGRWLARKLMQECGLLSRQPGKQRYRGAREEALASPNLLKRRFMPASPNQGWCGDISYICLHGGWCVVIHYSFLPLTVIKRHRKMRMNALLYSKTPSVTVLDNWGLSVRDIAYNRYPDTPDVINERITGHQYDSRGVLTRSAVPRLYETELLMVMLAEREGSTDDREGKRYEI